MSDRHPRLYLLDVEGTVAPISFVYEQLFPYARKHFEAFLRETFASVVATKDMSLLADEQRGVMFDLLKLMRESRLETDPEAPREFLPSRLVPGSDESFGFFILKDPNPLIQSMLSYVFWLMDRDRKSTTLKSLQGKIWKTGFESGELKGTLFEDVPAALARWAADGRVAIYSSGSVEAQRLLFRYSTFGDLTGLIAAYFDTRTGAKTDRASYAAIAEAMGVDAAEAMFFSDTVRELDAAREAGFATRLVVRAGNAAVEDAHGHKCIESFDDV